jgi:hypothetical protein
LYLPVLDLKSSKAILIYQPQPLLCELNALICACGKFFVSQFYRCVPTDAVILNLKDQGTFAFIDSDTKSALILFFV